MAKYFRQFCNFFIRLNNSAAQANKALPHKRILTGFNLNRRQIKQGNVIGENITINIYFY